MRLQVLLEAELSFWHGKIYTTLGLHISKLNSSPQDAAHLITASRNGLASYCFVAGLFQMLFLVLF